MRDVVVVGGGPAGLSLAHALVVAGVDCALVAPDTTWHATYGAWRDDVDGCDLGAPLDQVVRGQWPTVRVVGNSEHRLRRPYVVFDNSRLRAALSRGVECAYDSVKHVEHDLATSTLHTHSGATMSARLVIDATGSGSLLARRGIPAGAQTAYGVVVDSRVHAGEPLTAAMRRAGVERDVFTLMDWSTPPTFLYGARFDDDHVLLEETSLYANPPHEVDDLRQKLAARLGGDLTAVAEHVERVEIPMGAPLPSRTTRVVGFGAAAGFIHPVTGYSVAASLRATARVRDAIVTSLASGQSGTELSLAVWQAVWPAAHVRTRGWHDMGLHVLSGLPRTSIGDFFDAFFALPKEQWSSYLRIDSDPEKIRAAMLGVFRGVGNPTRLRLMSSPGALLRALGAR